MLVDILSDYGESCFYYTSMLNYIQYLVDIRYGESQTVGFKCNVKITYKTAKRFRSIVNSRFVLNG